METFGERLKRLRRERDWTQDDVAERMLVDRSTVSNWERLRREPPYETLSKLSALYAVSIDYLLGRTDDPQTAHGDRGTYLAERWPNLSPDRRERAEQMIKMPGIEGRLSHDITNAEFDVMWATLQAAIQAGLAISEANRKAAGKSDGQQD